MHGPQRSRSYATRHAHLRWASAALVLGLLAVAAVGTGPTTTAEHAVPLPQLKIIVLLGEIPDKPPTKTPAMVKSDILDHIDGFVREQSAQHVTTQLTLHDAWLLLPRTSATYSSFGTQGACAHEIIKDTIAAADAFVNFDAYTNLIVVFSGPGTTCVSRGFSPERSAVKFATLDGVELRRVALVPETANRYLLMHEFTHTLGLPDLYDLAGGGPRFMGRWDPMSTGAPSGPANGYLQGLSGFSQQRLGWLAPNQVVTAVKEDADTFELRPLVSEGDGLRLLRVPIDERRRYLVENRQPVGYDRYLPGAGVLITLENDDVYNAKDASSNGPARLMDSHPANSTNPTLDLDDAAFDVAPDGVATFRSLEHDTLITLVARTGNVYQVYVGRASDPEPPSSSSSPAPTSTSSAPPSTPPASSSTGAATSPPTSSSIGAAASTPPSGTPSRPMAPPPAPANQASSTDGMADSAPPGVRQISDGDGVPAAAAAYVVAALVFAVFVVRRLTA